MEESPQAFYSIGKSVMECVLRFEGWERAPELAERVKETNIGEAFRLRQSWIACSRGDRRE